MRTAVLVLLLAPAVAAADPAEAPAAVHVTAPAPTYDLGVRVGGYGFKREGDMSSTSWTECRMNGIGIFGSRSLTGPLFVELGVDVYTSQNFPTPSASEAGDLPISRMSGLLSTAIGVRSSFTSWLRGYAQLGGGVELARLSVPYGEGDTATTIRADKAMPEAFFGVGADVKVGAATYVGASFRMLVMGNFDYDPQRLQSTSRWVMSPPATSVFDASPDFAAQGQFYLRHDL